MSSAHQAMHSLLTAREACVASTQDTLRFQRALHFPAYYASKLSVEHTYEGHTGCVNRLAWNADGSLLVSGSDDRRAIIWHYPDVERTPWALTTEHRANIFGCQFLPCTGDRRIVTGAMDNSVQLHDLEDCPGAPAAAAAAAGGGQARGGQGGPDEGRGGRQSMRRQVQSANLRVVMPRTTVYLGHKDRVKDVKVEPMNPHNFWSAGEDGAVRQYDTRASNQDRVESPTVLLQVRDGPRSIQVKSIDINKAHPHLMALAGSDPYVRLYDRRKLSTGTWKTRGSTPPVLALAPPHMPLGPHARHGRAHATYVAFSNRGDKLVTTYHGDHAYSFDITASGDMAGMFPQPPLGRRRGGPGGAGAWASGTAGAPDGPPAGPGRLGGGAAGGSRATGSPGGRSGSTCVPLPPRAEEAKTRGNGAIFERRWSAAVEAFTDALHFAPGAAILYALRADALLRRGWAGDAAMALFDCDTAAALDEGCSRAFLSRIHALQALQQYQCALTAVDEYRRRFPGQAAADVASLVSQLRACVEERRRLYEARRQQQEKRRVQRREALARAPRRVTPSAYEYDAPAGPNRRRSRSPSATPAPAPTSAEAATAAATSPRPAPPAATTASGPAAAASSAPTAGPSSSPAAAPSDGGHRPASPGHSNGAATAHNGAGCRTRLSARKNPGAEPPQDADSDSLSDVYGPPPPPPPLPPEQEQQPAAATVPQAGAGLQGALSVGLDAAVAAAAGPVQDAAERPPAGPSAQAGDDPRVGPAAPEDDLMESVMEEEEVAGVSRVEADEEDEVFEDASEGRLRNADAGGHAADQEDGGAGAGAGSGPRSESEEEDSEPESWSGAVEEEEDPDMELFLQFYARSMEMVDGSEAGTSAAGAVQGRPAGHCTGHGAAAGARHVPGAWGGSPGGRRMLQRYVGQCNVQTDIKEATFIGADDRLVAAGSDCGRVFLYDADSGAVLRALAADEDVANCVQCHPVLPVLATSGIESVIRLWSPRDSLPAAAAVSELRDELAAVVERNQDRMKEGPTVFRPSALHEALQENPQLWHLLMNQLYGRGVAAPRANRGPGAEEMEEDEEEDAQPEVSCRMA